MTEFRLTPFDMLLLNTPPKFLKDETRKIRKRIYDKNYRLKNPEKIKENKKKYRDNNRYIIREKNRLFREENLEKENERLKNWKENNPEKHLKNTRKARWKYNGLNMENFEEIYKRYLSTTHCDLCKVELTEDKRMTKTTRVMDHSHITGEFRNILCQSCNSSLPEGT